MTAQVHELLDLDGQQASMACTPALPLDHPRLVAREPVIGTPLHSTACLRGYQGSWAIRDGRLYLVGVEGIWNLSPGDPLFADWFSGELRVVLGDEVRYVHGGFASEYARERFLTVERGVVTATREVDRQAT